MGLASAWALARRGHAVTVFEKNDRVGGLLRYGIPDFKLEKSHIDRRVAQMQAEGVTFRTSTLVGDWPKGSPVQNDALAKGQAVVAPKALLAEFDAETRFQLRAERGRDRQQRGLELLQQAGALEDFPPVQLSAGVFRWRYSAGNSELPDVAS